MASTFGCVVDERASIDLWLGFALAVGDDAVPRGADMFSDAEFLWLEDTGYELRMRWTSSWKPELRWEKSAAMVVRRPWFWNDASQVTLYEKDECSYMSLVVK